jgi:hypothetical protein
VRTITGIGSGDRSRTLTGFTVGRKLTFRVIAVNEVGTGPATSSSTYTVS